MINWIFKSTNCMTKPIFHTSIKMFALHFNRHEFHGSQLKVCGACNRCIDRYKRILFSRYMLSILRSGWKVSVTSCCLIHPELARNSLLLFVQATAKSTTRIVSSAAPMEVVLAQLMVSWSLKPLQSHINLLETCNQPTK